MSSFDIFKAFEPEPEPSRSEVVDEALDQLSADSLKFPNAAVLAFGTEDDTRKAIAAEVKRALGRRGESIYQLHENSGVDIDVVQSMVDGTFDPSDSLPLTQVETALGVSLRHL